MKKTLVLMSILGLALIMQGCAIYPFGYSGGYGGYGSPYYGSNYGYRPYGNYGWGGGYGRSFGSGGHGRH